MLTQYILGYGYNVTYFYLFEFVYVLTLLSRLTSYCVTISLMC